MTSETEIFSDQHQCTLAGRGGYLLVIIRLTFIFCALISAQTAVAVSSTQLLQDNNLTELETLLAGVQRQFESGELTEIDLRNTYRAFYDLDEATARNLTKWASSSPQSYVAHLALGIYLKRRGSETRGENYMADTSREAIEQMSVYYRNAAEELRSSMALTTKPYLSIFHLLTISMQFGDRDTSIAMLRRANEILPHNSLVRNRYAISLTPRWGGSYEQFDKFISDTKSEGVPENVVLQLEAIEHDDKGHALEEQHQHDAAMEHFRQALELATRVGGVFAKDFLTASRHYACSGQNAPTSCR
jgi:tetratricopeptide (TPR) repeat protein